MSRKVFLVISIIFYYTLTVQTQIISGTVWDQENDKPLAFASITFNISDYTAISNKDGQFSISMNEISSNDTLIIGRPGYTYLKIPARDLDDKSPIFLECEKQHVDFYDTMPIKTKGYKAGKIMEEMLDKIEENYGKDTHISRGFYFKEVVLGDTTLIAYSEGEIDSSKKGYKDNPKSSFYQDLIGAEKVYIREGFYQEFPVLLKDSEGQEYLFPFLTKGDHIGTFDIIKSYDGPFNTSKKITHDIKLLGESTHRGNKVYLISFTYRTPFAFDNGIMYINKEDFALQAVTFEFSDMQIRRYNTQQGYLRLVKTRQCIEYKKNDQYYSIVNAHMTSHFNHIKSNDNVVASTIYSSNGKQKRTNKNLLKQIQENHEPNKEFSKDFLSPKWENKLPFVRSSLIRNTLKKVVKESNEKGLRIDYLDIPIADIIHKSKEESKLIFLNLYDPTSDFTNAIEVTAMMDTRIVNILNDHFVSARINAGSQEFKNLFKDEINDSNPAQFIITDFYKHIYYKLPEHLDVFKLSKDLKALSNKVDFKTLKTIYDSSDSNEEEKGALISKEIYLMLEAIENSQKLFFAEIYMGKKKTWKDPKKMDFLFHHLIDERSEIYHNYFLEKLNDFKDRYTVNEINEKLKIVGMKEYILSGFNSDDMEEYFKEYFPVSADSLIKDIQLYRVSTMNDNPDIQSRSIMRYYARNGIDDWEYDRQVILDAILATDDKYILLGFLELLNVDWFEEIPHECLDLHALIYYKTGNKKKATNMVSLIREMALKKGINYQSSLHLLREKDN